MLLFSKIVCNIGSVPYGAFANCKFVKCWLSMFVQSENVKIFIIFVVEKLFLVSVWVVKTINLKS